jgi:hypothetical protein
MNPFIPAKLLTQDPTRQLNNPGNITGDMMPQGGERSNPYGDGKAPFVSTGLEITKQPQQRVIMRPGSRDFGGGSFNAPGDPRLIPSREVLNQIGAASGSTIPMGSQGAPAPRKGMDTSLSGARQRSGRG